MSHALTVLGKIDHCASCVHECGYWCCDFDADPVTGNYLVFYPGEWNQAIEDGLSLVALDIVGWDLDGGLRVTTATRGCCQASGPRPYKSFECRAYPFWPWLDGSGWHLSISARCPIYRRGLDLTAKAAEVLAEAEALARDPAVRRWFERQRCGGSYVPYVG